MFRETNVVKHKEILINQHNLNTPQALSTYFDSYDNKHAIICLRRSASSPRSLAV